MKKDDFKQKTHDLLDELKEFIQNLEQKADEIADDAREGYYEQLNNLKGIRDNLAAKLEQYEGISDSKWDVIKESAGDFFDSVTEAFKKSFSKVTEAFKKE
ncbi:MAG: hypothetical protein GX670_08975 [Bacteroidales bacterium]|jgi:ElaB/YqjD/DUF883 family membrane-anchored ribosome-binding protein|nr:hypothetical protein [Bacteroidales bacterium]